mmetsp:Transcript_8451/g.11960  ORF Transcript_8451/g.11960 Transcript_8451/m.11960 type:complete len:225 (-) Transcript_8451:668-1342(-)
MMSASFVSYASDIAGSRSVPRSMRRIKIVVKGNGTCSTTKTKKGVSSGMLDVREYEIDFLRLSKIRRPSSTPSTIEAKLSLSRIMSAAFLATSVPTTPIATPISACDSAGESFTPSPVTATTFETDTGALPSLNLLNFFSCKAFTMVSLSAGEVRANTSCSQSRRRSRSWSVMPPRSLPQITFAPMSGCSIGILSIGTPSRAAMSRRVGSFIIPTIFAIASAVS